MTSDLKITIPGFTKPESDEPANPTVDQVEAEDPGYTFPIDEVEQAPLDLLKSALTLIIAKAEAIDITYDKPKILGKLKGALELLNQN